MPDTVAELEKRLAEAPDGLGKIEILNALGWELRYTDLPRAIELGNQALTLLQHHDTSRPAWKKQLAAAIENIAFFHVQQARYDLALSDGSKALAYYEELGEQEAVARVYNRIGMTYGYIGDYPRTLENCLKALGIAEELGHKDIEARSLNNIGYSYVNLNENGKALLYLSQSLQFFQELNNLQGQVWVYESLCEAYLNLGDHQQAMECGLTCVKLSQEIGDQRSQAEDLTAVGRVLANRGDFSQALEYYQRALAIASDAGYKFEAANALRYSGEAYERLQRLDDACSCLRQAIDIGQQINARPLLFACHEALADIFDKAEDYQQALEHHKSFHAVKEAVFNERTDLRLKTIDVAYRVETAKKEAEIYYLKNVELQREIEERKKIQSALEELATTDPLTSLLNRRHFFTLAEYIVEQAGRYDRPLAVIMTDIDHFKRVNDTYGHAMGDQVLIKVARLLRENMRQVDLVARYGGEEFVILLPETNLAQATQIAERLRKNIASLLITAKPATFSVTASLGVADFGGKKHVKLDALLSWADEALYKAKQNGRNRTAIHEHTVSYLSMTSEPEGFPPV